MHSAHVGQADRGYIYIYQRATIAAGRLRNLSALNVDRKYINKALCDDAFRKRLNGDSIKHWHTKGAHYSHP